MLRNRRKHVLFRRGGKLAALLAVAMGLVVLAMVVLLRWPVPAMPSAGITGDFLVRDVALVDVRNGRTVPGRDVLVRGGRIHSIAPGGSTDAQAGVVVIDGAGRFLAPGLWDMHVHSLKISPQYNHPLFIANGVTGVREMWSCAGLADSFVACGDDVERWRRGLRDRSHLAPRYIERSSFAINGGGGVPADAPAYFRARNAHEARALAAHHSRDGADLLKTYTDLSLSAYDALAAEAPKHRLALAGHLPVRVPLLRALAAGQRSIEHPRVFLLECWRGIDAFRALPDPMAAYNAALRARFIDEHDPARCSRLMAAMGASGTWWTPTLQVLRMSARAGDRAFREDARRRYVPAVIRAGMWDPDADSAAAAHVPGRDVDGELYRLALDTVRQAHASGVRVLAGTDAGDTYVFPGFGLHDELAELVRAGLAPVDALRTATIHAAEYSGMAGEHGSIDTGKVADMVLLDADPLVDIRNTRAIAGVFFNGQYLDRMALDRLLAFAEERAGSLPANVQLVRALLQSPVIRAQFAD